MEEQREIKLLLCCCVNSGVCLFCQCRVPGGPNSDDNAGMTTSTPTHKCFILG